MLTELLMAIMSFVYGWALYSEHRTKKLSLMRVAVLGILIFVLSLIFGFIATYFIPASLATTSISLGYDLIQYYVVIIIVGGAAGATSHWLYEETAKY